MSLQRLFFFSTTLLLVAATDLFSVVRAENLQQTQQLLSTRECRACDLSYGSMVYTNLSQVDLQQANLSHANLSRVNFANANLAGANLAGAVLFNVNFAGADLSGADLSGADLRQAYLVGANLDGAILDNASLQGAIGLSDILTSPQMLFDMGLQEAERGNFAAAYDYYTQVLELKPDTPEVYLARSVARYQAADVEGAIADAGVAEELFVSTDNVDGQLVASGLAQRMIEEQERIAEGPSAGKPDFFNLLEGLVPFVFRFAL